MTKKWRIIELPCSELNLDIIANFNDANASGLVHLNNLINDLDNFVPIKDTQGLAILLIREKYINKDLINIILPKIYQLLEQRAITDFKIVTNSWQYDDNIFNQFNNLVFCHSFLLRTFEKIGQRGHYINQWNRNANRVLFLTGKPYKYQRIGLAFKFYIKPALHSSMDWSFFADTSKLEEYKTWILDQYTEQEYSDFINTFQRNLDPDTNPYYQESMNFYGYDYNLNLFNNTSLSVISETEFDVIEYLDITSTGDKVNPYCIISEKTWKTILNRHPFIMAGRVDIIPKLKSLGFRTFENYFKIPEYYSINDINDRLNAIVENTEHYIMNPFSEEVKNQINDDVEFNFNQLMNLVVNEYDKLMTVFSGNRQTVDEIIVQNRPETN